MFCSSLFKSPGGFLLFDDLHVGNIVTSHSVTLNHIWPAVAVHYQHIGCVCACACTVCVCVGVLTCVYVSVCSDTFVSLQAASAIAELPVSHKHDNRLDDLDSANSQ